MKLSNFETTLYSRKPPKVTTMKKGWLHSPTPKALLQSLDVFGVVVGGGGSRVLYILRCLFEVESY